MFSGKRNLLYLYIENVVGGGAFVKSLEHMTDNISQDMTKFITLY
jgi:hypothetical protein